MPRLPFGDIGPCEVHWGYGYQSGNMPQIIRPYLGKVMLRIADTVTDIHEEGKGIAPIDSFFEGTTVELEIPMTRTALIQLAQTIGWQKMGSLSGSVLRLDNIAGWEMYAYTETMVIKPLCNNVADTDPHNWIVLYRCHPYRDIELGFDRSGQRVHLVKFKVFPSRDSGYEGAGGGGQYLQEGMMSWREDFRDDFCEPTLKSEWTTFPDLIPGATEINLNNTDPCWASIEVKNNTPARWWWSSADWNTAPRMYMPLGCIGPCRITTKLRAYSVNIDTYAGIFIGTNVTSQTNGATNYYHWELARVSITAGLTYKFQVGSNRSQFGSDQPPDNGVTDIPLWLSIYVNEAQEIRFQFSKDGTNWLPYYERGDGASGDEVVIPMEAHPAIPAMDISNCYVGLFVKNWWVAAYSNISAPFEFFEIKSYA